MSNSYWSGYAPNYDRDVEAAYLAARIAENELTAALRDAYPLGASVRVVHTRNGLKHSFFGEVTGWDRHGARVAVRNSLSGKECKWWAAHVELVD